MVKLQHGGIITTPMQQQMCEYGFKASKRQDVRVLDYGRETFPRKFLRNGAQNGIQRQRSPKCATLCKEGSKCRITLPGQYDLAWPPETLQLLSNFQE